MSQKSISPPTGLRAWRAWIAGRRRKPGMWAFSLNRVTGLLLVLYLFIHLGALTNLARGPEAYGAFITLMKTLPFLLFDVGLLAVLLLHGLNGLRLTLVGLGVGVRYQRQFLWGLVVVGVALLVLSGYAILR